MAPKPKDKGKHASSSKAILSPCYPTRFATRDAEDKFHSRFFNPSVVCERPIKIDDFSDLPIGSWLQDRNWSYFFKYQGLAKRDIS